MTVFLVLIVIILFSVALWQMSKIYKLSQPVKREGEVSEVANNKDNSINAKLMLMFLIFLYFLMGYCFWHFSTFYPPGASDHAGLYDNLFFITLGVIMVVQCITQVLIYWFSYKYYGKKGRKALFYADNDKLEFVWTIVPVIVLSGLIIYGLFSWSDIMNFEQSDDAVVVELYAQRFNWKARYAGEDRTLGNANVRFIEGINTVGIDASDDDGQDDVVTQELHLPVGRQVIFKLRSQDVLHSAYMPHFRAQMNVVPGMITQFSFTPSVTTEEIRETDYIKEKMRTIGKIRTEKSKELEASGQAALDDYENFDYYLLCNKICGQSHYNMQMKIVVETEEEFQEWMKTQKTFRQTIAQE